MSIFESEQTTNNKQAVEKIIRASSADRDFYIMLVISVVMSTLGLLVNSVTVVIGSMLIAPILYPIVGTGLSIAIASPNLFKRSVFALCIGIIYSLIVAVIATLAFASFREVVFTPQIIERITSDLTYAALALAAGIAGAYSIARPELNESLPGTAIAVALVPPLSVVGIGIALFDIQVIVQASGLFIINILGIMFASAVVFALMNFSNNPVKKEVDETIKEEERKMEQENV